MYTQGFHIEKTDDKINEVAADSKIYKIGQKQMWI